MTTEQTDATIELVSDIHGINAASYLASDIPLYTDYGQGTGNYIKLKGLESDFDPDTVDSLESIDHRFYTVGLYVRDTDGTYWRIEWHEGSIIAVHPEAVWNDDTESYCFESEGVGA